MTYTETGIATRVEYQLAAAGLGAALTTDDTGLLDQYHAGGVAAVDKLIASLGLLPGDTVIDVGSGFGGPARRVAEMTGARVFGVDITASYVEAAEMLTRRTGLENLVTFRHADVMSLEVDRPFSAAITMHVQMNIADKPGWFAAIADVMAPGAKLAMWEVCSSSADQDATWPMPWSLDGSDSHVVTPDELLSAVTAAGLDAVEWQDETSWVVQWFGTLGGTPPPPGGLALPMVLDEGVTRIVNLNTALAAGTLRVVRGLFVKPNPGGAEAT